MTGGKIKRKGFILLLLALAVSLLGTACSSNTVQNSAAESQTQSEIADSGGNSVAASEPLGSFTAADIDNNQVDQEVWQGHKLTMINIWATYCGNCLREMPELAYLQDKYAAQDLQIIGIPADIADLRGNVDSDLLETAREIISKTGADYLQIVPSPTLDETLLKRIKAVPTTVVVDASGQQIGKDYVGAHTREQWIQIIDELLAQQPDIS